MWSVLGGCIFFLAVVYYLMFGQYAKIRQTDCLALLNSTQWKHGKTLREELERQKGKKVNSVEMYTQLGDLKEAGTIEEYIDDELCDSVRIKRYWYRLKN